ncbi:MAG: hypothetical protein K0U98_19470 [Deltaproteobacteria bacterium]|nr:hypothetical protein [Deltaproteobacteria bacterium]
MPCASTKVVNSDREAGSTSDENPSCREDSEYDEVFDRLSERIQTGDRIASSERENAPIRYVELLSLSWPDQEVRVEHDSKFHSYLLAEMLLERSREQWSESAKEARRAARLAVLISERLEEHFYGLSLKQNLAVRAWAYLGNAYKIEGNLAAAQKSFQRVDELLAEVALSSLERAEVLTFKVAYLKDRQLFDEAQELLGEMVAIYKAAGDDHQVGKSKILLGLIQGESGDPEAAVESFRSALELVEGRRDPRLYSCALGNLAVYLDEAGRSQEALAFLQDTRTQARSYGDKSFLARALWAEGRIASSLLDDVRAEAALTEAQGFFLENGAGYDAVLIGFDLAVVYARLNKRTELRELAQQMLPICASQMLGREAMAALILFQHAAEKELATLGLIEEISKYLKSAQVGGTVAADGNPA